MLSTKSKTFTNSSFTIPETIVLYFKFSLNSFISTSNLLLSNEDCASFTYHGGGNNPCTILSLFSNLWFKEFSLSRPTCNLLIVSSMKRAIALTVKEVASVALVSPTLSDNEMTNKLIRVDYYLGIIGLRDN